MWCNYCIPVIVKRGECTFTLIPIRNILEVLFELSIVGSEILNCVKVVSLSRNESFILIFECAYLVIFLLYLIILRFYLLCVSTYTSHISNQHTSFSESSNSSTISLRLAFVCSNSDAILATSTPPPLLREFPLNILLDQERISEGVYIQAHYIRETRLYFICECNGYSAMVWINTAKDGAIFSVIGRPAISSIEEYGVRVGPAGGFSFPFFCGVFLSLLFLFGYKVCKGLQ